MLSSRPSLDFRLHVQVFVEMVAAAYGARRAAASGGGAGGASGGEEAKEQAAAEAERPGQQGVRCGGKGGSVSSGETEPAAVGKGQGVCKGKGAGVEGQGEGVERAEGGGGKRATAAAVPSTRDILDYGRKQLQTRCCTAADRDVLQVRNGTTAHKLPWVVLRVRSLANMLRTLQQHVVLELGGGHLHAGRERCNHSVTPYRGGPAIEISPW